MNVIFMGTPDFAVPCLEKLIESRHNILAVYSQPDKPVGRKQILTAPPVKVCAQEHDIPVFQPDSLKDDETVSSIKAMNADVIIVVAYGKILPSDVLRASRFGCINVHASLLPKYRGAAPIQWAVLNGDKETGVTIMQMDEGLDTGDMLKIVKTEIGENETSEELFERLSVFGSTALLETLEDIENNCLNPVSQNDAESCYASKITRELSPIDWNKSSDEIHNLVRGLQSWPCALTSLNGKQLKIHKTVKSGKMHDIAGKIVDNKNVLTVCCGDGKCVDILELQLEGKKRMDVKSFLQGNNIEIGQILGE